MTVFLIEAVEEAGTWTGQYGPMVTYKVALKPEGDGPRVLGNMNQKPTTPAPRAGETIEATIERPKEGSNFLPKVVKTAPQRGGGGGGGKSPEERRSIQAQHAQKAAVDIVRIAIDTGQKAEDVATRVTQVAQTLNDQLAELAK